MHTSRCRNSIETRSLPIESVDYRFVILPVTVVDIHRLSCGYDINGLMSVILSDMQDIKDLS